MLRARRRRYEPKQGGKARAGRCGQPLAFPLQPVRGCASLCLSAPLAMCFSRASLPCRSPRIRSCAHRPLPLRPSRLHLPPLLRLLRLARRPLSSERSVSARTPLPCLLVPFMKRLRHHVFNVPLSCRWQPREQSPATATTSEGGRSGGGTEKRDLSAKTSRVRQKGQRPGSCSSSFTGQRFGQAGGKRASFCPKGSVGLADEDGAVGYQASHQGTGR